MKKVITLFCIILMLISLAGCSQQSSNQKSKEELKAEIKAELEAEAKAQQDAEKKQGTEAKQQPNQDQAKTDDLLMKEAINGEEILFANYDVVIVNDYKGKYLDKLEKKEINIGTGSANFTVAIFGEAKDVNFVTGAYQTEGPGGTKKIADKLSNTLLTLTNVQTNTKNTEYVGLHFDNNMFKIQLAPNDEFAKASSLVVVKDGQAVDFKAERIAAKTPKDGREYKRAFYGGEGFDLLIEENPTKEVVKGVPVNYLSRRDTNTGERKLLAQSVDRGEDWTNSIGGIERADLSNDGTKVYYEIDNTFNRRSGYGANDHLTRVYNLKTGEDSFLGMGATERILDKSYGPYEGYVILKLNSIDNAGQPTFVYQVVTPEGKQLVVLDNIYVPDLRKAIEDKLNQQNTSQQNPSQQGTSPSGQAPSQTSVKLEITDIPSNGVDKSSLVETIHGTTVEYSRYSHVFIPLYPAGEGGRYPFKYGIEFKNPAYSNPDSDYFFAVMGTISDVWIQSSADMNATPKKYKVADKIEDSIVAVYSSFPTDFSVDEILFKDNGKDYRIPITDMEEANTKVYAVKLPY